MQQKVKFWDPSAQYLAIKDEIDTEMQRVLAAGDLILREDLERFEENFAKYLGVKHVIGVASGTDALSLSVKVLTKEGDTIALPSYSFRAALEAIVHAGRVPVLFDKDEDWNTTDAVMPVHMEGKKMDWGVREMVMIEDSCQAVGVPVTGTVACYSFYPAKLLGCYGDGGAIATNDDHLASEFRKLRNHYKDDWSKPACNSRLDNLQAAVLNVKLKYLPDVVARRKEIARMYDCGLACATPEPRDIYQDYVIDVDNRRNDLYDVLRLAGIETMKNEYPFPLGFQKGIRALVYEAHSLRIPCNETLTDEQVEYVIQNVNNFLKNG